MEELKPGHFHDSPDHSKWVTTTIPAFNFIYQTGITILYKLISNIE
jgi:hypothetical protein